MKIYKRTGKCPICEGPTDKRYTKYPGGGYHQIHIGCLNEICHYHYISHTALGRETIGFIDISYDLSAGFMPGLKVLRDLRNKILDLRKRAIIETKALLADRQARTIFECFQSPNANHVGLSNSLFAWLTQRKDEFPLNYDGVKQLRDRHDRQKERREGGENRYNSDDYEQDGSSSSGGPVG